MTRIANHAILDRPIWNALTTRQAHLGQGDALVRRFHPDVAPFAALSSETAEAWQALGRLLQPEDKVALLSSEPLVDIEGLHGTHVGTIHQMIATRDPGEIVDDRDVIRLSIDDAPDMLDLTQRTKPGPFGRRTHEMGDYIGIREDGQLIAMAGERMRVDGYVEISAVCVDERCRGRGLAGRLINVLRREIGRRGDTPFLHVFSHNASAIGLYERLGFELRHAFALTQIGQRVSG